jgi:hypothetical protein
MIVNHEMTEQTCIERAILSEYFIGMTIEVLLWVKTKVFIFMEDF